jgi:DNA-binding MarR family transcriptional regulator
MTEHPDDAVVQAWVRLVRAEQATLSRIEGALKLADLPPLAWYDILLELSREPVGMLRPVELERRLLLAQYNASRLIDRMERAGLVMRRACPEDGRGQLVRNTEAGRDMQRRMWRVYSPAIAEHVGAKLAPGDAEALYGLLGKLLRDSGADPETTADDRSSGTA